MGGWLTRIEQLSGEFIDDCQWLFDRIKERRTSQQDLLAEFNRRIAQGDGREISRSALNRYVARVRSGAVKRPELAHTLAEPPGEVLTSSAKVLLTERLGAQAAIRVEELVFELISVAPHN